MIAKLFKNIDSFIFEQVLKAKTSPALSKVQESFNELDDHIQKIIKGILIAASLLLPFIICFILFIANFSSKSEILLLKESLERINHFNASKAKLNRSGLKFLAPRAITSQSDFTNRITMAASSAGVDLANIQTNDYNAETLSGEIQKSIINIKFQSLSSEQIFSMLQSLSEAHYIKYQNIEIKKNDEKNLLEGLITLNHFSKMQNNEDN